MATSQIDVETRVTELATQALKAFCDDISGTFGVDMECQQQTIAAETVAGLQKRFKKLVAVNIIDSEDFLGGIFRFIFDQNTQDMQTAPEKSDSEEPDIVEGNDGEESKQKQPSVEETPAETNDAGEIEEQIQTG